MRSYWSGVIEKDGDAASKHCQATTNVLVVSDDLAVRILESLRVASRNAKAKEAAQIESEDREAAEKSALAPQRWRERQLATAKEDVVAWAKD